KSEQIIQKLQERIEQDERDFSDLNIGVVLNIGDGIAFLRGLQDVQANELVRVEYVTFSLALNLEENQVGVIILRSYRRIRKGHTVYRTEEIVQVPVGDNLLGRIIDPLEEPLDNKGPIETKEERYIERVAPGVMSRQSVDRPLFTGLKVIDSMIPIGKGQR